jgi:predicted component of type VI protein secretion system
MTEQPQAAAPRFQPVPAMPITVLQAPKGVRVVATAAGVFAGATFLAAISAAMSAQAAEPSTQEQKQ